jgi:hypothetical protein
MFNLLFNLFNNCLTLLKHAINKGNGISKVNLLEGENYQ